MKKRVLLLALFLALLTACGGERETEVLPTCDELAQAVADGQGYGDLTTLSDEDVEIYLTDLYGLEEDSWQDAAIYAANGVDAREIAVVRLADGEDAKAVLWELRHYVEFRAKSFSGYAPAQADLLGRSRWMTWEVNGQSYVGLFICQNAHLAETTLYAYLRKTVPAVETPAVEGAATPAPLPDTGSYTPFVQPNENDMTVYDTSSILKAYRSGDTSALDSKEAAILEVAAKAVEEHTAEDMTDFEKELALHDWLMDWGDYDDTMFDRDPSARREDNNNPYGMLVGRYGNCLGYATTFQLLMELAGVECITVVGATRSSTADHAWNMVKLEGEWYCVDVCWNDSVGSELSDLVSEAERHRYFNVTSEYMATNAHQWDYDGIPWAAATRFFWDGTTWQLPT